MTTEDPIAEARRLLAERTPGEWTLVYHGRTKDSAASIHIFRPYYLDNDIHPYDRELIAAAPRLLQALLDRLDEAEREFRQSHANNCTPDYTERGLHSSLCRLYMVGPE